jgi:hypothetical protein
MKNIVAIIAEQGKGSAVDKAFGEGIHIGGERFVAFNIEGRHIYGRQVREPLPLTPIPSSGQHGTDPFVLVG